MTLTVKLIDNKEAKCFEVNLMKDDVKIERLHHGRYGEEDSLGWQFAERYAYAFYQGFEKAVYLSGKDPIDITEIECVRVRDY